MDPNAALLLIRQLAARCETADEQSEDFTRLVDLIQGLDGWITNGGFLPTAWAESRPALTWSFWSVHQVVRFQGDKRATEFTWLVLATGPEQAIRIVQDEDGGSVGQWSAERREDRYISQGNRPVKVTK